MNTFGKILGAFLLSVALAMVLLSVAQLFEGGSPCCTDAGCCAVAPCPCADGGECTCPPGECNCEDCSCGDLCGVDSFVRWFINSILPHDKSELSPCCDGA